MILFWIVWLNLTSSFGSIISVVATALFLNVVYMQLVDGKGVSRYPWATPQSYTDHLQHLLSIAYASLEWALCSPPKPHAFASLPLQSLVYLSLLLCCLPDFSFFTIFLCIIALLFLGLLVFTIFNASSKNPDVCINHFYTTTDTPVDQYSSVVY